MGGVEAIGMARDGRDTSPVKARNEAQAHYRTAIDGKRLYFLRQAKQPAGKHGSVRQRRRSIDSPKGRRRIIVTRPVLQADERGFCPVISLKNSRLTKLASTMSLKRLGASFYAILLCARKSVR